MNKHKLYIAALSETLNFRMISKVIRFVSARDSGEQDYVMQ